MSRPISDCVSTARGRISDSVRDQVVLVQTDRLEAVFGVELNDTLKKPTPRSNSLRQGFGQSRATGNDQVQRLRRSDIQAQRVVLEEMPQIRLALDLRFTILSFK